MLDLKNPSIGGGGMQFMRARRGLSMMVGKTLDGEVVLYFDGSPDRGLFTPAEAYRVMQAIGEKIGVGLPDLALPGNTG